LFTLMLLSKIRSPLPLMIDVFMIKLSI
jgi:hypothetical protein